MTPEELKALPEVPWVAFESYIVGEPMPDRVKRAHNKLGLRAGNVIHVPVHQPARCHLVKPDDLMFWRDEDGKCWSPTQLADGGWGKRRMAIW